MKRLTYWAGRHKTWTTLIVLLLTFVVFQAAKPTRRDYVYITERVTSGEVVRKVTASGKLRALNTIKVGAEVSGQITRVMVDYNSSVRAGQVLAVIDPTRLRAQVTQAHAQVGIAEATLAQALAGASRAVTDTEIQQREFGRRQTLSNRGFVSRSTLDAAQGTLAAARAGQRTAAAQVASARAQIAQANAELSSAMLELSRTIIVAPAAGVIIDKLVEPGTTVAASFQTPNLFEIAAVTTRMQVEASVDEADIGQVRIGQDVRFSVDAYPSEHFCAVVRQIRKAATETANVVSYLVILGVNNRDGKLLPGMTANVEIITGRVANAVRIPTTALRFRPKIADRPERITKPNERTVFVATLDPFKPTRRVVTLGLQGEDFVQITHGLRPGETVLTRSKATIKRREVDDEDDDARSGN